MRQRRLLTGWRLAAAAICFACASTSNKPVPDTPPQPGVAQPGFVSLDQTNDGATVLLYGQLTPERFTTDSIRVVAARLASRSPDPDEFRVELLTLGGGVMHTMHSWSPLGRHVWDSTSTREHYEIAGAAAVAIPVPARFGLVSVRLSWPDGRSVGTVRVAAELARFCLSHTGNPACRG